MTGRLRGWLLLAMTLPILGSSAAGQSPDRGRGLEINFIDVMGGAATLMVTPERESILIDSGWPGLQDRDPKRIVHVLKDLAGCDHLDHLVTTHWHTDHYGGVEGLSRLIRIDHFWDRGLPEDPDAGAGFPRRPEAERPAGRRLPGGQPGQAQGPQGGRLAAAQGRRARWCWPPAVG